MNFEDMKENAETGLRKAEVIDIDIRVRQETDWKSLSAFEVVGSCGRLWETKPSSGRAGRKSTLRDWRDTDCEKVATNPSNSTLHLLQGEFTSFHLAFLYLF